MLMIREIMCMGYENSIIFITFLLYKSKMLLENKSISSWLGGEFEGEWLQV